MSFTGKKILCFLVVAILSIDAGFCIVADVECSEHPTIPLDADALEKLNATEGDTLYIAPSWDTKPDEVDAACVTDVNFPQFSFDITQCVPIAQNADGLIILSYVVWNAKYLDLSSPIQRYRIFSVNFTCEFEASLTLTSDVILPFIERIGFFADPVDAEFEIDFELFDSDDFEDELSDEDSVQVPDRVFAEIRLSDMPDSADNFIVEMTECWATPDEEPYGDAYYPIISGSCPAYNGFDSHDTIALIQNGEPLYGRFSFESFVWTNVSDDDQAVYVHCNVTVCDSDAGECPSGCDVSGRRRREVQLFGDTRTYSAGPVMISPKTALEEPVEDRRTDGEDWKELLQEYKDLYEYQQSYNQELTAMLVVAILVVACILLIRREK